MERAELLGLEVAVYGGAPAGHVIVTKLVGQSQVVAERKQGHRSAIPWMVEQLQAAFAEY